MNKIFKLEKSHLENVNGFDLTPRHAMVKLIYSGDRIIELCKQYMAEKVGVELDFTIDIYGNYNDGSSTKEFTFDANFKDLGEDELELLDKAGIDEEELLETLLKKIFNTSYIDVYAYTVRKAGAMFELEMPANI